MRLMNPGLGELCDRLTIVQRKIVSGGPAHFCEERDLLLQALMDKVTQVKGVEEGRVFLRLLTELAAVNAQLWQYEDNLRWQRTSGEVARNGGPSALLAHQIQTMNDQRARLVEELGEMLGERRTEKMLRVVQPPEEGLREEPQEDAGEVEDEEEEGGAL